MGKPLCCDHAIDYTKTDPFAVTEWKNDPFDVVIDLACGVWPTLIDQNRQKQQSIVKTASKGGRYLATNPDKPKFEIHSMWQIMKTFLFPALWRASYSRFGVSRFSLPKYSYVLALPADSPDVVTRTLELASQNKLIPSIDPRGPFPFTTEGVREAFKLQASRHAKGKVVIEIRHDQGS